MPETVPNSSDGQPGQDALASLHRMSTTAGVSSQEYVAVNLTAVAAALAGLATALIFLSSLWLPVPAIAIVLSLVALRQISHSNGTQTGRFLAWGGLLLAVGISGFQLGGQAIERVRASRVEAQVQGVCNVLAQTLIHEDYQKAWTLFSDRFRAEKKIDFKVFSQRWATMQMSPAAGKVKSLKSNGLVDIQSGPSAKSMILVGWTNTAYVGRYDIILGKRNGVWQIDDLPQIFETPPPPQRGPPTAPGGGGPGPQ